MQKLFQHNITCTDMLAVLCGRRMYRYVVVPVLIEGWFEFVIVFAHVVICYLWFKFLWRLLG